MTTSTHYRHPVQPAPVSKNRFGFDEIMRHPDHTRFPTWYARFSRLAPERRLDLGTPPAPIAAVLKTGFGFSEIMRNPDYTRFPTWYAQFSYLAPGRHAASAATRAAEAGVEATPCLHLKEAA